jgi:Ser-tRNA(Ala) deacylase AlaX
MEEITARAIYEELKELRKELTVIRYALIPEEEVSAEESEEILRIDKEMEEGKRVKLEDALEEL